MISFQKKEENLNTLFMMPAREIKDLKIEWNEKMKGLKEKGYTEKEALNLKNEQANLRDLEFLKN